jgi:hypothetical protein
MYGFLKPWGGGGGLCKRLREFEEIKSQGKAAQYVEMNVNSKTFVWIWSKNSASGRSMDEEYDRW